MIEPFRYVNKSTISRLNDSSMSFLFSPDYNYIKRIAIHNLHISMKYYVVESNKYGGAHSTRFTNINNLHFSVSTYILIHSYKSS